MFVKWAPGCVFMATDLQPIYIIITKNIRYLLWNRGLWRSLKNTYLIFLTPCIRRTNHLCDPCDLTDVNPHFIPSLLWMIQNVDLLWRHRYKSRLFSLCFVTPVFQHGAPLVWYNLSYKLYEVSAYVIRICCRMFLINTIPHDIFPPAKTRNDESPFR